MDVLYTIEGVVKKGSSRGKMLGFPTANIELLQQIPEGIYAGEVSFKNINYKAAVFVGSAKTFSENEYKLEAYLLDFKGSLYGEVLRVVLYEKLRDNKKFKNAHELTVQMKKDVLNVSSFFSK